MNQKKISIIDEIKKEFHHQINNFNIEEISDLSEVIKNCQGNIYHLGVGKSGNMAKHCCDLLKCISYPSFFLNISNLTHGDIGAIKNNDLVLLFSTSGNTREIVDIIPLFKNKNIQTVGICCNKKSKFKELCDKMIIIPFNKEISGEINKIPTNSTMSQLIFSNILVSVLKADISPDKYKQNHLSGDIGKKLLKIKDILQTENIPIIIVKKEKYLITEILLEMTKYNLGICFFVDKTKNLIGLLTDGDIRRLILKKSSLELNIIKYINTNYHFESNLEKNINKCKFVGVGFSPVVIDKKFVGVINLNI